MTLNQYILLATVAPESVYAAPVGTIALDIANGLLWIKNTGTGNTGWVRALAVNLSALTANVPLQLDGSKNIITAGIALADSNDVDVSGLTDGQLVKRSGSALASTADYYTKTEMDAIVTTIYSVVAGKATAGTETGSSAGHTHTQAA